MLIIIAVVMGTLTYRRGWPIPPVTTIGFIAMLVLVWTGFSYPILGPSLDQWKWLLLLYAFAASVLPVWMLLQPRDYINSLLLYLGVGAMYVGLFVTRPTFVAPAVDLHPEGAPSIFPFVFIVIACGAASGFHCLVSSWDLGEAAGPRDRRAVHRIRRHDRGIAVGPHGRAGMHGRIRLAGGLAGSLRQLAGR